MTGLIATHSGSFHADDVFGVAVLAALFPQHRIVRTRDPQEIAAQTIKQLDPQGCLGSS